ncbi:MAG: hypothetical protein ABI885_04025 [Gammaproteobacteria bacterium]
MENEPRARTLGDYAGLLRRRWRYPVGIIPTTLLITVFVAYALPVSYRAAGTIMLEPSSIPQTLVPTTVTGSAVIEEYAGQQLELARRRVMSKESLEAIVAQVDPYPDMKELSVAEKAGMIGENTSVAGVDPITLEPTVHATAFSIYYQNPDPKLAAEVAGKLVNLFVTYNQRTRAELAQQAYTFLHQQASQLESSMRAMEQRLAALKTKYGDALPDSEGRNIAGADRAQRDVEASERQVLNAEQQRDLLQLQLNELSPSMTGVVGDWRTELAKARTDLALAEQKYTPEHPDVKRLKRAVADLVAQSGANSPASGAKPDNPDYLRVQSQLGGVDRELGSLRASAARARQNLATYERNLASTPNAAPEYVQLAREYENTQSSYRDLQVKMKSAALAQSLESEARGERFALVRGPSKPKTPFSPNRIGIILLGFVISTGLAIVLAVISDASDPTVRSVSDLTDVMEVMPVGAIPVMLNKDDRRHLKLVWGSVAAVFAAATVVVAATVISNY